MLPIREGAANAAGAAPEVPARVLDSLAAPLHAQRILVIRLGALGDVVRTRFAFASLRRLYPRARIDWLVEDHAAAGLDGIADLDGIVRVPRRQLRAARPVAALHGLSDLVDSLRASRYDLAVDFHCILKSALLAWASRIPQRVGYAPPLAREGSSVLLTHRARITPEHVSRFERNAALVRFLGGEPASELPELQLPQASRAEVSRLAAELVVMHPGTSTTTLYKRWPPERYAAVARELRQRAGIDSLLTWGPVPGEREAAEAVVSAADGAAHLAPETGSIAELLLLMRGTRLFIGSDSGPMHLASLAGLPVVAVFGPTDPVENAPFAGLPQRVLRRDVGCNPCRDGCPAQTCMAAVGVADVVAAALELLPADLGRSLA
ncbi:MAG: glycosyltransferase family 9 protein [Myxococcota bacterium]